MLSVLYLHGVLERTGEYWSVRQSTAGTTPTLHTPSTTTRRKRACTRASLVPTPTRAAAETKLASIQYLQCYSTLKSHVPCVRYLALHETRQPSSAFPSPLRCSVRACASGVRLGAWHLRPHRPLLGVYLPPVAPPIHPPYETAIAAKRV